MTPEQKQQVEAGVFRRLVTHLDNNKDVQNIDLMILADFCRNCLSKWYAAEAKSLGEDVDYDVAREVVYGMPYSEWKAKYQTKATSEQITAFEAKQVQKQQDKT